MSRAVKVLAVVAVGFLAAGLALAQQSAAAMATRQQLQQKITDDFKEVGVKAIFDDIKSEMDMPVSFKIDNMSGISNNSKLTYVGKDKTVEQILNDISDKGEFGWFVKSDPKDRL